ncbi:MAG: type VI secretion system baseplate subunit TssE [Pseudomonadota bacterium]|nr:type VI secretion system baseplate subunit TssE [Pseudomonadota bacterium]
MAFEHGLLERLATGSAGSERSLDLDAEKTARSVALHLNDLLNTRQGSVAALPEYGLPDFNDLVFLFPNAIARISRSIRESIERFEPRLEAVRVEHCADPSDPLRLKFTIRAQLAGCHDPVVFSTVLDGSGHVVIRS